MIDYNDEQASAKPRRGIPAAIRAKLKEAIKAHLKEHGRRKNRHLLREHPELSAWIGHHVGNNGETGDKRLDRAFDEVEEELARGKRRVSIVPTPPSTMGCVSSMRWLNAVRYAAAVIADGASTG